MTFRELLNDQGIDPNALLRQEVGDSLEHGGITARLEDGVLDIHVVVKRNSLPPKPKRKARKR
jgi:hypothetical protein